MFSCNRVQEIPENAGNKSARETQFMHTEKPNVILILADDIGYEIPTCDGGESYKTLHIDQMASEGMRFTQCHASPLCSPSRFMLLTGKYNFRNYTKWGHMDLSQRTIGNMFKDAGYKTAVYGKWQLGGGDNSIHTFGFDNYCVFDPYDQDTKESRYKNPVIYQKGAYVAPTLTLNKYGEDIFCDSVLNFIDSNKTSPFFIYYPMVLGHTPESPTPDDPDFASWDPDLNISDTKYFPSMVKYMDKKIGLVINKVKSLHLADNTIIIVTGDNGTSYKIFSSFQGNIIEGGKGHTIEYGTHVPFILYWKGVTRPGAINDDMISFVDFLPALAGLANIPVPTTYGTLDGISFHYQVKGEQATPRKSLYFWYKPYPRDTLMRWAQDKKYKLYDTFLGDDSSRKFYNFVIDPLEKYSIPKNMTPEQLIEKQQLKNVLYNYHQ